MASDVVVVVKSKGVDGVAQDLRSIGSAAESAEGPARNLSKSIDGVGTAGGDAETALRGVADIAGVAAEQFGLSLGPLDQYVGSIGQLAGGVEALAAGAPAFFSQLATVPAKIIPAVAATWTYVTALTAQAIAFIAANAPLIAIVAGIGLLTAAVILIIKHWDTIVEKIPFLGTAVEAVKTVVTEAAGFLTAAFQSVLDFLTQHWPEIAIILSGPFAPLVILATDGFGIRTAMIGFATALPGEISGAIGNVASTLKSKGTDLIQGLWDGLVDLFNLMKLQELFQIGANIAGAVGDLAKTLWNAGKAIIQGLWDGMKSLWSSVIGWVSGLAGEILSQKGPLEKDKVLLYPVGVAIMQGLAKGMADGFDSAVVPVLQGVTQAIRSSQGSPGMDSTQAEQPVGTAAYYTQGGQMTWWEANIGYVGSGNAPKYGAPFQSAGRSLAGRGGGGMGGMTLIIQALDAQGVRDWLNRGGGQQILKWVNNQKSFA